MWPFQHGIGECQTEYYLTQTGYAVLDISSQVLDLENDGELQGPQNHL